MKDQEQAMDALSISSPSAPDISFFSEAHSAEVVNARMRPDIDPRLKSVMEVIVRHLHAAVKEIEPTHEEWLKAIEFLTATGQMCTDWRQEFILLSDVLGVTMLIDALNHRRPANATENTILGPFYVAGAPHYPNGADICMDHKGEPMLVRGKVLDTEGKFIAAATIDSWQTNEDGFYDVQQSGIQPEWNLRGVFTSGEDGGFWYRSVKPRFYPIPDDGPVGKLLGQLGRHPNRAAHVHFIVTAPGYEPLITHIFTPDCRYLREDTVFGVKDSLIGDFVLSEDVDLAARCGISTPFWLVDWNFVLTPLS
jgi:catechol 1,2-dioxygenase